MLNGVNVLEKSTMLLILLFGVGNTDLIHLLEQQETLVVQNSGAGQTLEMNTQHDCVSMRQYDISTGLGVTTDHQIAHSVHRKFQALQGGVNSAQIGRTYWREEVKKWEWAEEQDRGRSSKRTNKQNIIDGRHNNIIEFILGAKTVSDE
uniref:Mei4-dependent protein 6 n=1 Tax=Lygus hesperus TaxID=30085 RepID=A0A0A9VTV7_LYGHE